MGTNVKQHYYWLDALRFAAAFLVILSHSRNNFLVPFYDLPADARGLGAVFVYTLCRVGHEAVVVFFVLSGFLVGGRGLERISSKSFGLANYTIDRFCRIMPPLVVSVILWLLVNSILGNECDWLCALGNVLSLQGICCESLVGPFWSLSYEVWFYILLGTIGLSLSSKEVTRRFGFVAFFIVILIFTLFLKPHYLMIWLMGALAYLNRPKKRSTVILALSCVGILIGIIMWQMTKESRSFVFPSFNIGKEGIEVFLSLMMSIFIQQVILFPPQKAFSRFVEKTLGSMAKFSYTLYLSHETAFLVLFAIGFKRNQAILDFRGTLLFICFISLTIFLCWVIYLFSERYSVPLKQWVKKKLSIDQFS